MISAGTVGRLLGDFGATVIKVEHPDGDHLRRFGPQKDGAGLWWKYLGRNKQSVTLDISTDAGRVVFEDLLREADVLVENFRPGTLERWGLDPERLTDEVNEDLVACRISGFGQTGPYAERPGFGTLAESMSGFAFLNGFPDREPLLPPTGLADGVAAMYATFSVMFALWNREVNGGGGQVVDTSLIEPIFSILGPQPLRYDQLGDVDRRSGNRSTSSAPRNVYETGDGRYVAVSASTQPTAMRVFDAIDRPDLKDDSRFATNEKRVEHVEELDAVIADWMADRDRETVLDVFEDTGATIAPIYNVADIVEDPHYRARDAVVDVDDDDLGSGLVQGVTPKFGDTPGRIDHLGPALGAHNDAVYGDFLGYDAETRRDLESEGVI